MAQPLMKILRLIQTTCQYLEELCNRWKILMNREGPINLLVSHPSAITGEEESMAEPRALEVILWQHRTCNNKRTYGWSNASWTTWRAFSHLLAHDRCMSIVEKRRRRTIRAWAAFWPWRSWRWSQIITSINIDLRFSAAEFCWVCWTPNIASAHRGRRASSS